MKTLTNVSEVYAASGGDPLARSNPVVTEVNYPRIIPYTRRECECCCASGGSACGCLLAALCMCGARRARCGSRWCGGGSLCDNCCRDNCCRCRCGGCCGNACGCPCVITAFYGRGCGCRSYTTYYPYY